MKFNIDPEIFQRSNRKLEKLIVDFTGSDILFCGNNPYVNIFSTMMRLFPSDLYLFHGPSTLLSDKLTIVFERSLANILENMWKHCDKKSEVFFEFHSGGFHFEEFGYEQHGEEKWILNGNNYPVAANKELNSVPSTTEEPEMEGKGAIVIEDSFPRLETRTTTPEPMESEEEMEHPSSEDKDHEKELDPFAAVLKFFENNPPREIVESTSEKPQKPIIV
uniref:Ovule protein n=2 Tax=Caenorhabditis tropicalis TaxID=1561998 RepID=A0A1I7TBE3_9PELO